MKKLALILSALILVLSMSVFAADDGTTAAYATVKPVIDGQIDEIWQYTSKQVLPDDYDISDSYTQILWDETGLYFLAAVGDTSITEDDVDARNSVDLWISEKNTKSDGYASDPGDWHFCKSSDGHEIYYTGNSKVYDVAERAVARTDKGYIVELYVPYLSDIKAKEGTVIGYTVSINDDFDGDGVRDAYVYWTTSDLNTAYWENTSALVDITLTSGPDASIFAPPETEAPAEEAPATETAVEAPTVTAAPRTFDMLTLAIFAAAATASTAVALGKRRK